jgi:hypothetical protein
MASCYIIMILVGIVSGSQWAGEDFINMPAAVYTTSKYSQISLGTHDSKKLYEALPSLHSNTTRD